MRCLYCGKHLPLFRKLTGGGEFCSDAHRDKYHEEYNRLAVTRLLQAQTRPEEQKAVKQAAAPSGAIAVAVEPDEHEIGGSYINEFQHYHVTPAACSQAPKAFEISSLPSGTPGIFHPSMPVEGFPPPPAAEFVAALIRPATRAVSLNVEEPTGFRAVYAFPARSETPPKEWCPEPAKALTQQFVPEPRPSAFTLLETRVKAADPQAPKAAIPGLTLVQTLRSDSSDLPRALPLNVDVSCLASQDAGQLMMTPLAAFLHLDGLRPSFDSDLQLLAENAEPPPREQKPPPAPEPEAVDITPRRALDALARLQYPPARTELLAIAIPALAPSPASQSDGFGPLPLETKPRMMRNSVVPLRPKMAVGTVSGPVALRSAGARPVPRRGQTEAPKNMPRSMLHLEDESQAATAVETDPESTTLFGKLGGLFGRKNKS